MFIANNGLSDDHATKDLRSLAKLGNWGKHTGNCAKQLKMFLGEASVPPPMMREVPLSMGKRAQSGSAGDEVDVVSHVELSNCLPHVSFSWYYHNDKARFNELYMGVCTSTDDIVHFWTELLRRGDPRLAERPMKNRRNWKSQALPIALHGDVVPVLSVGKANPKSFDTYSIQGVFCRGPTLLIKQLVFGVWTNQTTEFTAQELWRIVNWSLFWLYKGKWSHVDWNAKPLTDAHPA